MQSSSSALRGPLPAHQVPPAATCDVRAIESAVAMELYITASPGAGDASRQAERMYGEIAHVLRDAGAVVVQERLFASSDAVGRCLDLRADAYGDLDDGVAPTMLCPRTEDRLIVGAQVHAICGIGKPRILRRGDFESARVFACNGYNYLTASGVHAPRRDNGPAAQQAFEALEHLLGSAGGTMGDVARTWLWMDDILAWYPEFNQVRTRYFTERGLMSATNQMPASTGIGVSPAGARIALDVFAAWGKKNAVERFSAAGNQRSAYEYGSAFARAARVKTPGGATIFCSGTAAIDERGKTCFVGDCRGQVRMTIDNVIAVLRWLECSSDDVVQAMAYCANPKVADHFLTHHRAKLPWPILTMIGDVCRSDLLFEIEVTACPTNRSGHCRSSVEKSRLA